MLIHTAGNTPDNVTSCHNYDQTNEVCGEHNSKTDPLMVSVMFGFAGLPSQTQRNTGDELLDHVPSVQSFTYKSEYGNMTVNGRTKKKRRGA
jgi:hypothetical protein